MSYGTAQKKFSCPACGGEAQWNPGTNRVHDDYQVVRGMFVRGMILNQFFLIIPLPTIPLTKSHVLRHSPKEILLPRLRRRGAMESWYESSSRRLPSSQGNVCQRNDPKPILPHYSPANHS